ncbi:MAG: hypothetical protein OJF59_001366 [Cytophagales bacterium]|jgi:4-amino-4-deoxy-L-arabinose transferase-like glycosyltransferase|nr:hypothetical protein [Bacteroidota bacterium]MBS1982291.1 hypothetical protein [Bacteroidota bacterium]WHZ07613.1 MAG: hypothetical protein OJF59_001366 [Cytophagales bacterium]
MNRGLILFTAGWVVLILILSIAVRYVGSNPFTFPILISIAAATWGIYFFMTRTSSENLVKNYLLSIVLKLLAGGIFILAIIFIDKPHAEANAIFFMVAYLLFTGLEVGFLLKRFN